MRLLIVQDLLDMLPDARLGLAGNRQEVVIYTGWTVHTGWRTEQGGIQPEDTLIPMEDD